MSNQLIQSKALKDVIQQDGVRNRLKEIMGARAPQFAAALVQLVSQSYQLQKCEPNSVIGAALTAAALDLSIDPNLGEAHVVPYKEKATFQIGYVGFGQLAQRSGMYKNLGWCVIHDGELVSYDELSGEMEYKASNPNGPVIGYAAKFKLVNGFERAEYWTAERIEQHAYRYSASYRYAKGDKNKEADCRWVTDRDRMALKTVLKSLLKIWGPKSIQMQKALKVDEGAIIDADSETVEFIDNPGSEIASPVFKEAAVVKEEKTTPEPLKTAPVKLESLKTAKPSTPPVEGNPRVDALLQKLSEEGIKEEKLINFLKDLGTVDAKTNTLAAVAVNAPEVMELLEAQLSDIIERVKQQ